MSSGLFASLLDPCGLSLATPLENEKRNDSSRPVGASPPECFALFLFPLLLAVPLCHCDHRPCVSGSIQYTMDDDYYYVCLCFPLGSEG